MKNRKLLIAFATAGASFLGTMPLVSMKLRVPNPKRPNLPSLKAVKNEVVTLNELDKIIRLTNENDKTKEVIAQFRSKLNEFYQHAFNILEEYEGIEKHDDIFKMMFLKLKVVLDIQRKEPNNVEQIKRNINILDDIMKSADNELSYFVSQDLKFQALWDKAVLLSKTMKAEFKTSRPSTVDPYGPVNSVEKFFGADEDVKTIKWFKSLLIRAANYLIHYYDAPEVFQPKTDFEKAIFE
ncbi:Mycoplasma arthritidis-derived mitogen [Metamycoplasma arthritidis]|uniref:Superantigen n=1 Tax=Metamycoplasma arthritidis (strain 158L3-1) TaxID=243272 RepID=B3PN83_META1|nr:superantigen MAM [Metamycoplasma arthritidis]ACF07485.1 hypothetical protein MARTH_orf729 [Metamycoplasma arthritidis 158L3-1]VEU79006.1 Mycoplasma arthritidis-derived mitogen [Metamycoplasma arthritidis]